MVGASLSNKAFELLKLKKILKTSLENPDSEGNNFWDAKFYPFDHSPEAPPIFALSNTKNLLVCRISSAQDNDIEILRVFAIDFRDEYCACTWAFINADEPLLLGAGESGILRVFDVANGELKTSLVGHGQGVINDLATHPKYPWIVASASQDTSVRIWDLRRYKNKYESPCVVICGHGNGHREMLLSVSWHDNGRYIVTGGVDHRICVWTLPDLSPESTFWKEISPSQRQRHSDEVRIIYYPHFVTSAIHTNFVDCVRFWGDLILSKASGGENKIVLWSITGFNSHGQTPDATLAPKTEEHLDTRNGFVRTLTINEDGVLSIDIPEVYQTKLPYTRLLEFRVPASHPFFIRFDILRPSPMHPDLHPVLVIGNTQSQVFFYDLEALELGYNPLANSPRKKKMGAPYKKGIPTAIDRGHDGRFNKSTGPSTSGAASTPSSSRDRSSSLQRTNSTETGATSDLFSTLSDPTNTHRQPRPSSQPQPTPQERDRDRYPLHLPKKPIEPTRTIKLPDFHQATFTARGVGWSPDGRWCVVAGETAERSIWVGKTERERLKEEASTLAPPPPRGGRGGRKAGFGSRGGGRKGEGEDVSVGAACVFGRW